MGSPWAELAGLDNRPVGKQQKAVLGQFLDERLPRPSGPLPARRRIARKSFRDDFFQRGRAVRRLPDQREATSSNVNSVESDGGHDHRFIAQHTRGDRCASGHIDVFASYD
jgi:hypothetical protein